MMRRKRFSMFMVAAAVLGLSLVVAPQARAQQSADRITIDEFKSLLATNAPVAVIDVRGEADTKIKGALHVPLGTLEMRLKEIPRDREVVTYCA